MERWQAYEAEWAEIPFVDDMVAHFLNFKKPEPTEVPMTREQYRKRYGH